MIKKDKYLKNDYLSIEEYINRTVPKLSPGPNIERKEVVIMSYHHITDCKTGDILGEIAFLNQNQKR